jgi:hypothetical protein
MKKALFALLLVLGTLSSCKKETEKLLSPDKKELSASKEDLLAEINQIITLSQTPGKAVSIKNVVYYDSKGRLLAIIDYLTEEGHEHNIGIEKKYDEAGKIQSEMGFSCKGSCDCKVGVVKKPDGTLYSAECTCSPCSMTVTVYESAQRQKSEIKYDIQSIANRSHLETFNKSDNVKITDLRYNDSEKALVELYTYENSKGQVSTFMMIRPKTNITTSDNRILAPGKTYIVDCKGSCDCRERFLPASGGIECTCEPCTMTVTEVPPAQNKY